MEQRLRELRTELERGQQEMARLDLRRQELRDTLLRISGAIQVLEELKSQEHSSTSQTEISMVGT